MDKTKEEIIDLLKKASGVEAIKINDLVLPPSLELGDLSFPCFGLSKVMKKAPGEVAVDLKKKLKPNDIVVNVEVAGPYLNFFLNREKFSAMFFKAPHPNSLPRGERDGNEGKRVMIEYISPNNNKPLHLGHLRNAFLGESVARLLESQGAKVIRACLFNDRGLHIAKSMVAYTKWGKGKTPKSVGVKGDKFIGDLYVEFEKKSKNDPRLMEEAEKIVIAWEKGDKKTRALWQKLSDWAMAGFNDSLKRLKIKFDNAYFESKLWKKGKELVVKGLEQGIFKKDAEGCVVADLETFKLPPKVMIRSNGTAIYSTTDLALGKEKFSSRGGSPPKADAPREHAFGGEKNKLTQAIWCVGSEQDLYLKQLFAIYKIFGFPWFNKCQHLSYGLVFLPEGKMKSREGKVVEADDLLNELHRLVVKEIQARHKLGVTELKKRAEIIAQAALRFYLLSVTPKTIVRFSPQESISFTGRTGPYLLYTYARIASILRKARMIAEEARPRVAPAAEVWPRGAAVSDSEWQLIMSLARFDETVSESAKQSDPARLAQYLYDLAKSFSDFYENSPVLQAEPKVRQARLALISAVKNTLSEGLRLLTIETVEEM